MFCIMEFDEIQNVCMTDLARQRFFIETLPNLAKSGHFDSSRSCRRSVSGDKNRTFRYARRAPGTIRKAD